MAFDFNDQLSKDQKEIGSKFSGNSKYFNLSEGNNNVFRVLTPGAAYASYFLGKGQPYATAYGEDKGDPRKETKEMTKSIKYILYVVDRSDGLVKQAELPYTVMRSIGDLQKNPDYSFDDLPMPYDIRVTYNKAESPANKYKVVAVPKLIPVTPDELGELEKMMAQETPDQAVEKKKENQMKADQEAGIWLAPEKRSAIDIDAQEHPSEIEAMLKDVEVNPDDIPF